MVKDLVCGMDIEPESAAATSEYEGTTYYFCAAACKEQFDAAPAKFLGAEAPAESPAAPEPPGEEPAAAAPAGRKWWQFWRS